VTTSEVIVFPDVQALLCDYLRDRLAEHGYAGIFVGSKVPIDRPDEFIRVMVVGGERRSVKIDAPRLVVESWAATEESAADLAAIVRGLIFALDQYNDVQVYNVNETQRPTNLPDPKTSHERFTATYIVPVEGHAI